MYKFEKEHSFKTFSKDIKSGEISNVILMHGEEQYLIDWAIDSLVNKYVNPSSKCMDYLSLKEENVTIDNIISASDTFSMFSERRVVVVKDFLPLKTASAKGYGKEDVETLIDYIKKPNDSTILILTSEEIDKKLTLCKALISQGEEYDFSPIDKGDLQSFIKKNIKKAGKQIDSKNLRYMIELSGYYNKDTEYRLYNLDNDIKKAVALSDTLDIGEEIIKDAISGDIDTYIFNLIDAVSYNKKEDAYKILYNILSGGTDPFKILALLVSQFELMLSVKELREEGSNLIDISKILKIHEFRIKKAIGFSDKFSLNKIKETLTNIYQTDKMIKSGNLDSKLALELFIAKI